MAKFYSLIFLVFILGTVCTKAADQPGKTRQPHTKLRTFDKTLMIRVKREYRNLLTRNSFQHPKAQALFNTLGLKSWKATFPHRQTPRTEFYFTGERIPDMTLIYKLQYEADVDLQEAARLAINSGLFEYAEPKYIRETTYVPNDPSITNQYALDSIQAYQAWDITKGDTNVVIGICDSGVQLNHLDLLSQIKNDPSEPVNGIDDNNDGKIDNNRGWDFCGPTTDVNYEGDNNATITQGGASHGTHVAGISAAATHNNRGIAGIGYNCKIMPLKCAPDDGGQSILFGYEAIEYGASHGASVINCSWGGEGGYSLFEQEVITDATLTFNCLIVAAAGNDNSPNLFYPAYYEHVLAVSALGPNNQRANFTNYNYKVRVGAPGVNILSTYYNNTYQNNSGTSMASPVVAGVAGLVRSKFPFLTPDQVAQRIRVTADNVYTVPGNTQTSLFGKLGRGIVNAYRAVLEQTPGVKNIQVRVTDNNNNIFQPGDTLYITGDFINFLQASSPALKVKFSVVQSVTSTYVTPIASSSDYVLGTINTNEIKNSNPQPFKIFLKNNLPTDRTIDIRMYYSDGAYYDYDHYSIVLNPTYINVEKNNISTTLTSKGRIGFNDDGSTEGIGFQHKKRQTLYELGLISGTSAQKIANTVRNTTTGAGATHDNDYRPIQLIREVLPPSVAQFEYQNSVSDVNAGSASSNIDIIQKNFVFTTPGDSNYVIVDYLVKNKGTVPLSNFYLGYFGDFDISQNGQQDKAGWSATRKLGYIYNTNTDGLYAGISILGNATPNYYAIDNDATAADTFGVYDGFSDEEKYIGLSSGLYRLNAGVSAPKDVSLVIGAGPYTIPAGDTIHIGFAIVGGENLQQIEEAADNAQEQWPLINITAVDERITSEGLQLFPNPAQNILYLNSNEDLNHLQIFNVHGSEIKISSAFENGLISLNTSTLVPGLYIVKIKNRIKRFIKN